MVLDGQGRSDEAIDEFQAAESLHEYPPGQMLSLGVYEERHGHLQGAIEQYTRALQGSTDAQLRSAALAQLGEVHSQLKDYEQVRQDYQRALTFDPDNIGALMGTGLLARRDGDAARAVAQFSHAAKLQPSDTGFLFLADALRQAGRLDEAKADEDLAGKISSDLAQARRSVNQAYLLFGIVPEQAP